LKSPNLPHGLYSTGFPGENENGRFERRRPDVAITIAKPSALIAGGFVLLTCNDLSSFLSLQNQTRQH
jgi:hypothetical protein